MKLTAIADVTRGRMKKLLISNARLINEGAVREVDVLVHGDRIEQIGSGISAPPNAQIIDAAGKYLMPGMIDDQVHFREPGMTHKGDLNLRPPRLVGSPVSWICRTLTP